MAFNVDSLGDLNFGGVSKYLPNFSGIGQAITQGMILFFVVIAIGVCAYLYWDWRRYKYKIEIYENLGGTRYVKTGVDRAKIVRVGDGGEEILWLKGRKCYRTAYGRKMGKNLIWFAIGQDGYWYNFTLGDLDAKQGELDIEPVDRDMRYMHVAIRKNIQDRYRKMKFMEKYGSILMNGIFLIIMIFGLWFCIDKMGDVASTYNAAADVNRQTMETIKGLLSSMDNLCSGSGITSA